MYLSSALKRRAVVWEHHDVRNEVPMRKFAHHGTIDRVVSAFMHHEHLHASARIQPSLAHRACSRAERRRRQCRTSILGHSSGRPSCAQGVAHRIPGQHAPRCSPRHCTARLRPPQCKQGPRRGPSPKPRPPSAAAAASSPAPARRTAVDRPGASHLGWRIHRQFRLTTWS